MPRARLRACAFLAGLLGLLLLAPGPAGAEAPAAKPVPRGARLLGLHVTEAEDGDFGRAYAKAREVGTQVVGLSVAWDEIEPEPGTFRSRWLPIANAFYGPRKMRVALVLKTLDTARNRFPKDLRKRAFDDPVVVGRLTRALDWMLDQVPDLGLTSLSIGNEVDGVLGTDAAAWAAYTRLFEAARADVRTRHPSLPVGTTCMYAGLTGGTKAWAKRLNRTADVVLLTYYPLDAAMRVRPNARVAEAFRTITGLYPGRPIHFGEIGCPSGRVVGSSPAHQADFVCAVFRAWDRHARAVPLVAFCWLTDPSEEALALYRRYYGSSHPRFVDFLRTLGLRSRAGGGRDKPAFGALRAAARARGFAKPPATGSTKRPAGS